MAAPNAPSTAAAATYVDPETNPIGTHIGKLGLVLLRHADGLQRAAAMRTLLGKGRLQGFLHLVRSRPPVRLAVAATGFATRLLGVFFRRLTGKGRGLPLGGAQGLFQLSPQALDLFPQTQVLLFEPLVLLLQGFQLAVARIGGLHGPDYQSPRG